MNIKMNALYEIQIEEKAALKIYKSDFFRKDGENVSRAMRSASPSGIGCKSND